MSANLVLALRVAADRIEAGALYQWGHMGQCNCGHLAQVVTTKTSAEIHQAALRRQTGEWTEFAQDVCSTSGSLIDDVLDALLDIGLSRDDIGHLENLSDDRVVAIVGRRLVRHDSRDAVLYFRTLADVLSGPSPLPRKRAA
jgi:uncharacterized protein YjiS (DUF1127 family)